MGRMDISRRTILKSATALSALAALGIKPSQVLAADADLLKVRMEADIQVLDPGYMIGGAETSIDFACLPRLAVPVQDDKGNWGWLPSDYVEKIVQEDPTHIPFTLKQGLMWSGSAGELTAEDVKYSFERMLKSDWAARFPVLDHVEVTDKYSGVVVLKNPFAATFLMGIASESGSIVPKSVVSGLKDEKFTTELPAQLGPYIMTEWTPKQRVVLKINPDWKGTPGTFKEIHFVNVEDTKAAELAYEAGEVAITNVLPDTAARYQKQMPPASKLITHPGPYYTWIGLNSEHEKLKDIRVRKAIQRAIDVDSILAAAYGGVATKGFGVVTEGIPGYRTESKYGYNPDEARALLAEAGVSDLSLEFKTFNEAYRITAAQIVQANLADVGIKLEIIPLDSGPFWNLGLEDKGDEWKSLQMWWMRYRMSPDPSDGIQWFLKNQVGVWNWERWSDPEFEDLWAKGLVETDDAKRNEIYLRMQEIMEDTGCYVWITHDPISYIYSEKIVPAFDPGSEVRIERFTTA
ncbi:MAG: ABC transporter substrate-binding protein [Hyphomicrobiaceae bacterium]